MAEVRPSSLLRLLLALGCAALATAAERIAVCAEDDFYPYSALRGDKPVGMTVDLVRAAFRRADIEVEFQPSAYNRCLTLVKRGQTVATFDTARTSEREQDYLWPSEPLTTVSVQIWGRAGMNYGRIGYQELHGRSVGVVTGYEYPPQLWQEKEISKVESRSELVNLKNVAIGRLDFTPVDAKVAAALMAANGLQDKLESYGTLTEFDLYMVFSRRHPDATRLMERFETGFKRLRESGEYRRIHDAWPPKRR
ncbi:substrate-binding periplasmic protein [Chitinimonas lacunae]|uniref:Substrate-binding periplasmic protein n=1 Tax=Chitinimonas lacunae TaxID=1963018 RepID=A0ABV8MTG6_9NEIS